jgi:hypothetical protein
MSPDTLGDTLTDDRLEQRLRAACHAVIPHLTDGDSTTRDALDRDAFGRTGDQSFDASSVPVGTVTALAPARPTTRSPLVGVAAAALLVIGGAGVWAMAGRSEPTGVGVGVGAAPSSVDQLGASTAPFQFATPKVRLSAAQIEVIDGDRVIVPPALSVAESDPGTTDFTTIELKWLDDTAVVQRLHIYFASDGVSWWATEIRTTDATGEWVFAPQGQRWFTSPLGTAWTGDLELANLRITGLTVEAFLRPAACDDPTGPIAVVSAYPTIDAAVGGGFGGRIDLIDTATCTPIDATPYGFTTTVDDTSIAVVTGSAPFPEVPQMATTVPGMPPQVTTVPPTVVPPDTVLEPASYDTGSASEAQVAFGRFSLEILRPGTTTVRVTVTDPSGAVVGTVAIPLTAHADQVPGRFGLEMSTTTASTVEIAGS